MTDERILAKLEKVHHPLGDQRGEALAALAQLRSAAHACVDAPAHKASLEGRKKKLREAAEALMGLPEPFLEFYRGIATHLISEADATQAHIDKLPDAKRSRPAKVGKRKFISNCDYFFAHFFPAPINIPPGQTLLTFNPEVRSEVIALAKRIWDEEKVDSKPTSLKAWKELAKTPLSAGGKVRKKSSKTSTS